MELNGARVVVVGATGVLGSKISRALQAEGASLGLAGRDRQRLDALADELGGCATGSFDAMDLQRCGEVVEELAASLGGLDAIVVALGVAAFDRVEQTDDVVTEHVLTVNTLAPIAAVRAALQSLGDGGTVAAVSAVLADFPTANMAVYSASKAALSSWLTALRHEQRRSGVTVFDIRPPHMDTGLADRAVAGTAPALPEPFDADDIVGRLVAGLRDGARELYYDARARQVSTR